MFRFFLLCIAVVILAGCAVGNACDTNPDSRHSDHSTSSDRLDPLQPDVVFLWSSVDLAANQFRLTVVTAGDETLIDTPIVVTNGEWTYEAPNTYAGDPAELTISAVDSAGTALDIVSVGACDGSQSA